jgi:anti-sigma factor RsiW
MMTHPTYEELNDYADNVLSDDARQPIHAHVASCAECAAILAEIAQLQRAAQTLPTVMTPPADVWDAVRAGTIDNRGSQRKRVLWGLRYQLAAAAVVLLLLGSSLTWFVASGRRPPIVAGTRAAAPQHANLVAYRAVEAEYSRAAADLIVLLQQRRANMDTAVVRSVEENLRIMDAAIANARAALMSDPANQDVAGILTATQESKLRMLRRAVGAT